MRKPFYRKNRGVWVVKVDEGDKVKLVTLGKDQDKAFEKWRQMVGGVVNSPQAAIPDANIPILKTIFDAFIRDAPKRLKPATIDNHHRYAGKFIDDHASYPVISIRRHHLAEWLSSQGYSPGAERGAIESIKAVFAYAVEIDLISVSPFNGYKKPPKGRKERLLSKEEYRLILAKVTPHYRPLIMVLWMTGMRPQEVRIITKGDVCDDHIEIDPTRAKGGKVKRIIYLSPCATTLFKILSHKKTGHLFTSRTGNQHTYNSIRLAFDRLKKLMHMPDLTAYAFRHTFATRAITSGLSTKTVAELLGHKNSAMIDRHYGHLGQKKDFMVNAVGKVV